MVVEPTDRPVFNANPVGELVIANTAAVISLKLSVPSAPARLTLVLGTFPRSAGVSYIRRYVILAPPAGPGGRLQRHNKLYVDRFGEPPVGTRVFICTTQQIDGWQDKPKQTNAVVLAG